MISDITFAQLLNARMSHELAGSISAVNNGLEFLASDTQSSFNDEAHKLVFSSAENMVTRLLYYRNAYGVSKSGSDIEIETLKKLLVDFKESRSLELDLTSLDNLENFGSDICKLILNFYIVALHSLIYGGKLQIEAGKSNSKQFVRFVCQADRLKFDDSWNKILSGDFEGHEITTSNIHFYYCYKLLQELQANFIFHKESSRIIFSIIL